MSDDLLDILSGGKDRLTQKAGPADPVDFAIRTVYGEANPDTASRQAVAAVIHNRASQSGKRYDQVVTEPGQFEPWSDPKAKARMLGLSKDSPEYRSIQADIAPVLSGDVSYPYTHFYAPDVMKGRGQSSPAWDDGTGVKIGTQLFFAHPDATVGDLNSVLSGAADDKAAQAAYDKAFGAARGPIETRPLAPARINPNQGPSIYGAPGTQGERVLAGLGQGVSDVGNSINNLLEKPAAALYHSPANALLGLADPAQVHAQATAERNQFDQTYGSDPNAIAGRFGGSMAATLPAMALGGEVAAPLAAGLRAVPLAAPAVDFLAGTAGRGGLGAGNMLLRGGSRAAQGAIQGAEASALNSGASDASFGQQVGAGAALGGALGPAGMVLRGTGNKLFGPKLTGAAPAAEQNAIFDAARNLPVPVRLTQGQITLAPAQQMIENAMMRGANGDAPAQIMRDFAGGAQSDLRGNLDAITSKLGGTVPAEAGQGGAAVSAKLNAAYDTGKRAIDDAYDTARRSADGAYLPAAERGVMNQQVREALKDYDITGVPRVERILSGMDQSPTSSTFTPTDIFEARSKLSTLRAGNDAVEAGAAGKAVKAIDGYIDDALSRDLISGDPTVVKAWRDAIGKRRDFGKLFEGDDLINGLTQRTLHGDSRTLKVAPEDAANYILGRSDLGFVGKKDLARDLTRLRGVLGDTSPEWGALRSEVFGRIARAGEGAPEGGAKQFSGQKFMKAWEAAKTKDPQVVRTLFSDDERTLIDQFAEVAQRATTPIKGGDNPSNSAVAITVMAKKFLDSLGTMAGGALGSVGGPGGAAVGAGAGRALDAFLKDVGAVVKARKATSGAAPIVPKVTQPQNNLLRPYLIPGAVIGGNRLFGDAPAAQ